MNHESWPCDMIFMWPPPILQWWNPIEIHSIVYIPNIPSAIIQLHACICAYTIWNMDDIYCDYSDMRDSNATENKRIPHKIFAKNVYVENSLLWRMFLWIYPRQLTL